MKRVIEIALPAVLVLGILTGCGGREQRARELDFELIYTDLHGAGGFSDLLSLVDDNIAAGIYDVDPEDVTECKVYCSTGATAEEIGLFRAKDEAAAGRLLTAARARAESQKLAYEHYAPAEIPKLDTAVIKQNGVYVFYVVSGDPAQSEETLDKYF